MSGGDIWLWVAVPSSKLDVNWSIKVSWWAANDYRWLIPASWLNLMLGSWAWTEPRMYLFWANNWQTNAWDVFIWSANNTGNIVLQGKVGIRKKVPTAELDIEWKMKIKSTWGHIKIYDSDDTDQTDFSLLERNWWKFNIYHRDTSASKWFHSLSSDSSNGYVGVGILTPLRNLHVKWTDNYSQAIIEWGTIAWLQLKPAWAWDRAVLVWEADWGFSVQKRYTDSNWASTRMRIHTDWRVWINEASPTTTWTTKLEVRWDAAAATSPIRATNKNITAWTNQSVWYDFGLSRNSGAFKAQAWRIRVWRVNDWNASDTNIDAYMDFWTFRDNTLQTHMTILDTGSVWIWINIPGSTGLHVQKWTWNSSWVALIEQTSPTNHPSLVVKQRWNWGNTWDKQWLVVDVAWQNSWNGKSLAVITNNSNLFGWSAKEVFTVLNWGKVWIWQPNPSVELDVNGGIKMWYYGKWWIRDNNGWDQFALEYHNGSWWNDSNIKFKVFSSWSATLAWSLTQNSDERLKENIQELDSSLEKISKIMPVSYNWKDKENRWEEKQFWIIAQELEKIYPELVSTDNDEIWTKSVNYVWLIWPLLKAVQEQQEQIEKLKEKVAELEK